MLQFDETTHTYTYNGEIVLSVTQILREEGLYPDYEFVDPWFRNRGTLVHKACHMLDMGKLDRGSIDPEIIGYIKSYEDFKRAYNVDVKKSEQMVFDEDFFYAGTYDKFGVINIGNNACDALIDIKCGGWEWGYQFQTALYVGALKKSCLTTKRLSVHLRRTGGIPTVIFHNDNKDIDIARAAVIVHNEKRKHRHERKYKNPYIPA